MGDFTLEKVTREAEALRAEYADIDNQILNIKNSLLYYGGKAESTDLEAQLTSLTERKAEIEQEHDKFDTIARDLATTTTESSITPSCHDAQLLQEVQAKEIESKINYTDIKRENYQRGYIANATKTILSTPQISSKITNIINKPGSSVTFQDSTTPRDTRGSKSVLAVLEKCRLQELVSQIDTRAKLSPEVEEVILEFADNFIEEAARFACIYAKHRDSNILELKDIQLHLEKNCGIHIPGFSPNSNNISSTTPSSSKRLHKDPSETHKKRVEGINKQTNKTK